jgi:hypothetical protein
MEFQLCIPFVIECPYINARVETSRLHLIGSERLVRGLLKHTPSYKQTDILTGIQLRHISAQRILSRKVIQNIY